MVTKFLVVPEKKRTLAPPFAWIDRRFLFNGLLAHLSGPENLLYFFLVLAADQDGLSYYSYDKICATLKISVDEFIAARDGLLRHNLIAYKAGIFQVLALPISNNLAEPKPKRTFETRSLKQLFQQLHNQI